MEENHFTRTAEARKAIARLREIARSCKTGSLKDESLAIAQEADDVLKQMEDKALDPDCNLLHETIGLAALKAEDAVKVLQGCVIRADKEASKGGLLKVFKNIGNQHKEIFKSARDGLKAAVSVLAKEEAGHLTDSDDLDAEAATTAAYGAQQQQQQQHQLGPSELHLTWDRGVKVLSVNLAPGPSGMPGSPTLWVGLNKKTVWYVGCNSAKMVGRALTDKGHALTSATWDAGNGYVWTGQADGAVNLFAGDCLVASFPPTVGLPIRSMAVDSRQCCWVGDDAGIIRVLKLDPSTRHLRVRFEDIPPQAQPLLQAAARQGPAAAAALAASTAANNAVVKAAPVIAMLGQALAMFTSGGKRGRDSITVWNCQSYEPLEMHNTTTYGTACSFISLPWDSQDDGSAPASTLPLASPGAVAPGIPANSTLATQQQRTSPPGRSSSSGAPATGIPMGYGPARATVPSSIMAAAAAKKAAAAVASGSGADTGDYHRWRLLSGHEKGQVLLWRLQGVSRGGPPGSTQLLLLACIGEPKPQGAIRCMGLFKELSMLVLAHASGNLTVLPMPTAANGATAANSSQPYLHAHFGAVGGPVSANAGFSARGPAFGVPVGWPASAALHKWTPRTAQIKAHKNGIVTATCLGELLVTASNATVKSWTADRLQLEAQADRLMFSRAKPGNSTNTSEALAAALAPSGHGRSETADRVAAAAAQMGGNTDGIASSSNNDVSRHASTPIDTLAVPAVAAAANLGHAATAPPASITAANPMSRQQVMRRGLAVDPQGTVLLQNPEPPAAPWSHASAGVLADVQPHIPPIGLGVVDPQYPPVVGTGAGVPARYPSGPLPVLASSSNGAGAMATAEASQGALNGASNGSGLEATTSVVQGSIRVDHVICSSELVLKEVIGSGAEGKVYRGSWTSTEIAAKEYLAVDDADAAKLTNKSPSEAAMQGARDALRKEVMLLTSLNHPNVVRFCGVCLDPPLVVMEFYKHGSVYALLEKARRQMHNKTSRTLKYVNYLTYDRRLEMLHDVAAGMIYLHKRYYVHGDLRSPNLFVGSDAKVKIGDFGFTKRLNSRQGSMTVKRVTHPRWVAPELLNYNRLSSAADVYSFGIIMYEMLTWKIPFEELSVQQVVLLVVNGGRPELPRDAELPPGTSTSTCLGNYIRLMQECWDQHPNKRPSFESIAARLKAMIHWRAALCRNTVVSSAVTRLRQGPKAAAAARAAAEAAAAAAAAAKAKPAARIASVRAVKENAAVAAEAGCSVDDEPLPLPDDSVAQRTASALGEAPPAAAAATDSMSSDGAGGSSFARVQRADGCATTAADNIMTSKYPTAADLAAGTAILPVPSSIAAHAPAGGRTVTVVKLPGAGELIVGSDLPSSPRSIYTLTTKDSNDVGLSTTDGGGLSTTAGSLPTPLSSTLGEQLQPTKSAGAEAARAYATTAPQATSTAQQPWPSDATGAASRTAAAAAAPAVAPEAGAVHASDPAASGPAPANAAATATSSHSSGAAGKLDPIQETSETFSNNNTASRAGSQPLHRDAVAQSSGTQSGISAGTGVQQVQGTVTFSSSATAAGNMAVAAAVATTTAAMAAQAATAAFATEGMLSAAAVAAVEDLPFGTALQVPAAAQPQQQLQQPAALSPCVMQRQPSQSSSFKVRDWLENKQDLTQQFSMESRPGQLQVIAPAAAAEGPAADVSSAFAVPDAASAFALVNVGLDKPLALLPQMSGPSASDLMHTGTAGTGAAGVVAPAAAAVNEPALQLPDPFGAWQQQQQALQGQQPHTSDAASALPDPFGSTQVKPGQQDVFMPEESPFYLPTPAESVCSSVQIPSAFGRPAVAASMQPPRPYFSDASNLDDTALPPLGGEYRLGAALTIAYVAGMTPAAAAATEKCVVRSSDSFSAGTCPSLEAGVAGSGGIGSDHSSATFRLVANAAAASLGSYGTAAGPFGDEAVRRSITGASDGRPVSFTTSPFTQALMDGGAATDDDDDDVAEPLSNFPAIASPFMAAGGVAMEPSTVSQFVATGDALQPSTVSANNMTSTPFGGVVQAAGPTAKDPSAQPIMQQNITRQPSPGIAGLKYQGAALPGGNPQCSPSLGTQPQYYAAAGGYGAGPASSLQQQQPMGAFWGPGMAPTPATMQGVPGWCNPAGVIAAGTPGVLMGITGDNKRISGSSHTSSHAGTPATSAPGLVSAQTSDSTPATAAGFDKAMPAAGAAAQGTAAAAAGSWHQPLDESVLGKPLDKALGRASTAGNITDKDVTDIFEARKRDLQVWESRDSNLQRRKSGHLQQQPGSSANLDRASTAITTTSMAGWDTVAASEPNNAAAAPQGSLVPAAVAAVAHVSGAAPGGQQYVGEFPQIGAVPAVMPAATFPAMGGMQQQVVGYSGFAGSPGQAMPATAAYGPPPAPPAAGGGYPGGAGAAAPVWGVNPAGVAASWAPTAPGAGQGMYSPSSPMACGTTDAGNMLAASDATSVALVGQAGHVQFPSAAPGERVTVVNRPHRISSSSDGGTSVAPQQQAYPGTATGATGAAVVRGPMMGSAHHSLTQQDWGAMVGQVPGSAPYSGYAGGNTTVLQPQQPQQQQMTYQQQVHVSPPNSQAGEMQQLVYNRTTVVGQVQQQQYGWPQQRQPQMQPQRPYPAQQQQQPYMVQQEQQRVHVMHQQQQQQQPMYMPQGQAQQASMYNITRPIMMQQQQHPAVLGASSPLQVQQQWLQRQYGGQQQQVRRMSGA